MPLVLINKAKKPEWQDIRPPDKSLRDAYAIAARHVERFSRAFKESTRLVLDDASLREMRRRYVDGQTVDEIIDALPWFNPAEPKADARWNRISQRLMRAYGAVVNEANAQELLIEKAAKRPKKKKKKRRPRRVPTVPVNPLSVKWAEDKSSELVVAISDSSRLAIRQTVARALEQGLRADAMTDNIKQAVGLLEREEAAVERRRLLLLEQGFSEAKAKVGADKYAEELLTKRAMRIARTETIAAQNRGLLDKWKLADEAGELPAVERVWVAPPISDNPNRPCPICIELDGKTAKLNEPFESAVLGGTVDMPPSHPNCRCTQVLRRVE